MASVTCNVREIDAAGRRWLETFLGQPLADDERVIIQTVGSGHDEANRWADFETLAARAEANIRRQRIGAEEIGAAVDEAIESVRSKRPEVLHRAEQGEIAWVHIEPPGLMHLAGSFADDPTLRELCEEIYRERDAELQR